MRRATKEVMASCSTSTTEMINLARVIVILYAHRFRHTAYTVQSPRSIYLIARREQQQRRVRALRAYEYR